MIYIQYSTEYENGYHTYHRTDTTDTIWYYLFYIFCSVPDPWHFGVDPDPRIHASDQWIRIRILDPDPAIFVTDLQDASKKQIF